MYKMAFVDDETFQMFSGDSVHLKRDNWKTYNKVLMKSILLNFQEKTKVLYLLIWYLYTKYLLHVEEYLSKCWLYPEQKHFTISNHFTKVALEV